MKNNYNLAILSIFGLIITLITSNSVENDFVFAQSSSDDAIGQDGDGNSASQSEKSAQSNNQNAMCVSGE